MDLNRKALLSVPALTIVIAVIIFFAAGTFVYWQAWLYLLNFMLVSLLITIYLIENDPELLKRRMRGGPQAESRGSQKLIMLFTSVGFIGLMVVPGLDQRFGWSSVPTAVVLIGDVLVAVGFYFIFLVYRENTYTSATIEVAADQKVIDSGPYKIVRHPMYASALLYLFGTPLALASYWGLIPFAAIIPLLMWRLLDEESLLKRELTGYDEYQRRVRYRLLPGIW